MSHHCVGGASQRGVVVLVNTLGFVLVEVLGCLVQVGNGIELEAVGFLFEPYRWRPCSVTWDSSRTVVVIKLLRTSALLVLVGVSLLTVSTNIVSL